MTGPWAEVIGDPVGHSLSPLIHRHWLNHLDQPGSYRATRVERGTVAAFIEERRADPAWRGCNVTAPHKQAVTEYLDRLDPEAVEVGAVNCVYRNGSGLAGANTDLDGIGEALAGLELSGHRVAILGGGGAARAAVRWLDTRCTGEILLLVRRPERAAIPNARAVRIEDAADALAGIYLVVNATPLGLEGGDAMPGFILDAVANSGGAAAFDMVYRPAETAFLAAGRSGGLQAIDGLAMLIGQARRSFRLLFGADPPASGDLQLRRLLEEEMAATHD